MIYVYPVNDISLDPDASSWYHCYCIVTLCPLHRRDIVWHIVLKNNEVVDEEKLASGTLLKTMMSLYSSYKFACFGQWGHCEGPK